MSRRVRSGPRPVTWRTWAVLGVILAADAGAGFAWSTNGRIEAGLFRWGLFAASLAPLVFVAVYTWTRQKWWRNDVGLSLVWLAVAAIPTMVPLCWVLFFDNGRLAPSWLAWMEISGPTVSAVVTLWVSYVWVRIKLGGPMRDTQTAQLEAEVRRLREQVRLLGGELPIGRAGGR